MNKLQYCEYCNDAKWQIMQWQYLQGMLKWNVINDTDWVSGKASLRDLGPPSISYLKLALALLVLYFTWEQAYFLATR